MKEYTPILLLLVGLPGAGKSTWIKDNRSKWKNTIVICPDEIRKEVLGSVNDQSENYKVFQLAKQMIVSHLKEGINVVLDTTNTDTEKRIPYIESISEEVEFQKIALIFYVSPDESKRRIKTDIKNNVDRCEVTDEGIDIQYDWYRETLRSLPSEGFKMVTYWEE
jgi:predicted kinase